MALLSRITPRRVGCRAAHGHQQAEAARGPRHAGGLRLGCLLPSLLLAGAAQAATVLDTTLSFTSRDQSLWGSGDAFRFSYDRFIGLDVNPNRWIVNPNAIGGTVGIPGPVPDFDWRVNPYFEFNADLRVGMQVSAALQGGAIDARLDYSVLLDAPTQVRRGEAFSISSQVQALGSSGFSTRAPSAQAALDGILDFYMGGYVRIETSGDLGEHDYRMGNRGFTDNRGDNGPYRTLADVNLAVEMLSFNRGDNGQLRVLGVNRGGVGSEYAFGPGSVTVGDWRVSPTGRLDGNTVRGSDATTLVTAALDIDQMVLLGSPALGTGVQHDWGVIAIDLGYELIDLDATLAMGLKQDLAVDGTVLLDLQFSEAVLIDGQLATSFRGAADALPQITLVGDSVTVTPTFLVDARLRNQTALSFAAGAELAVLEAHARASYDVSFWGVGREGQFLNAQWGPFYTWDTAVPLGDIPVMNERFVLEGFESIAGQSFLITAVPEPGSAALLLLGAAVLAVRARRRPGAGMC